MKDIRNQKGTTLVELLVAMSVFLVVILMAVGIFLMGMGGTGRLFGRQNALDSARYILESMGKEIRMSEITNPATSGTVDTLVIEHPINGNITYQFTGNNLEREGAALNPDEVAIDGDFVVTRSGDLMPRVTIVMKIRNVTNKPSQQVEVNLQTTVSSRAYKPTP